MFTSAVALHDGAVLALRASFSGEEDPLRPASAATVQHIARAMLVVGEHNRCLPNSNRRIGHGQSHKLDNVP